MAKPSETKPTLWDLLERHDWFYSFSDDHRYWVAGFQSSQRLNELLDSLNCPHSWDLLRQAVHNEDGPQIPEVVAWIKSQSI